MIVVNTETIPGMEITEVRGIVQGNTVRAKHVGRDIAASLKNIVGGELTGSCWAGSRAGRRSAATCAACNAESGRWRTWWSPT